MRKKNYCREKCRRSKEKHMDWLDGSGRESGRNEEAGGTMGLEIVNQLSGPAPRLYGS